MSVDNNDKCDCTFFEEGDWVESKLNTNVFGIIVGEADFGRFYNVQLAGSLEIKTFHGVTLRHTPEHDDGVPLEAEDTTNVVQVDFTKGRTLAPDTETEGAA